jgi:hypothetical protein
VATERAEARLTERTTALDTRWGELLDVDVSPAGDWIALFRTATGPVVRSAASSFPAPRSLSAPRVRWLDSDRCVVVDCNSRGEPNAWVSSREGTVLAAFYAGDAIQDILAGNGRIVATFFDEGVYGRDPGPEGIVVYDDRGRFLGGYRSRLRDRAVIIDDCYAACWDGPARVAFCPYGEPSFPLIRLDVETFEQEMQPTPDEVHGSSALSTLPHGAVFWSPYRRRGEFLAWTFGSTEPRMVGSVPEGAVRGLGAGRFLRHDAESFSLVDLAEATPR